MNLHGAVDNREYILKHSVGNLPFHSEIDVLLTYTDYYFLGALRRYQQWILNKKFIKQNTDSIF